ncbi:MAG TPA: exopolysaccharide biosynthesis polyprenyl glycosylphosphotransferase [Sphingomonas sp.]|jgi:exopolysaccharide biosynthesis polyprenyl glycosylphosphotransferase
MINGSLKRPTRELLVGKKPVRNWARMALLASDVGTLVASFFVADALYGEERARAVLAGLHSTHGVFALSALVPVYVAFAVLGNAYADRSLSSLRHSSYRSIQALLYAAFAFFAILYFAKASAELSRLVIGIGFFTAAVLLPVARIVVGKAMLRLMGGSTTTVLVVSDGVAYQRTGDEIVVTADEIGFDPETRDPFHYHAFAHAATEADRLIVACSPERYVLWSSVLKSLTIQGELLPIDHDPLGVVGIGHHHGHRTMIVAGGAMTMPDRILKRLLDLAITIPALVLLSPLMLAVAIAIRAESAGPVFFRQNRIGRDNKIFPVLKFRSMYTDMCDSNAVTLTQRVDPRVTRVGAFIRHTSIDELPQLLNVLVGTMSIVGPRPHPLSAKAADLLYWDVDARYRHRHVIKPGLTGLAQVRGFRGNTEQVTDLTNRLEADLEYLVGWSLPRDIQIIFQTLSVLRHQNAF